MAQWQKDGVAATLPMNADQVAPVACGDSQGGMIVAWVDARNGNSDIYAQHFNANGARLWGDNALPVCTNTSAQTSPAIVSDGKGGAIIVWRDKRDFGLPLYAQRLNFNGTALWTANGVLATYTNSDQAFQQLAATPDSTTTIAWMGWSEEGVASVYSQRLNSSGGSLWQYPWGSPAYTVDRQPLNLSVASDGAGGVLVAWYFDCCVGGTNIQRLDSDGNKLWGANGVQVYSLTGINLVLSICGDGAGGALVSWRDNWGPVRFQHVTPAGQVSLVANGIVLTNGDGWGLELVPDNQNGAVCVWMDNFNIIGQRVDATGGLHWGANGTIFCDATDTQDLWGACSDGQGGAIAVWTDRRNRPEQDIFAQRVDVNGNPVWLADGVNVCTAVGYQDYPVIVADGSGGAIFAWEDDRGAKTAIFAQRIGSEGNPMPTFLSYSKTTPGDGFFRLEWTVESTDQVPRFLIERTSGALAWQPIGELSAQNHQTCFSFVDRGITADELYRYRVLVDESGGPTLLFETGTLRGQGTRQLTAQAYPNPSNPDVAIRYVLPKQALVTVTIYAADGRLVNVLSDKPETSGEHTIHWHGTDVSGKRVASGVYLYQVRANKQTTAGKLVLLK